MKSLLMMIVIVLLFVVPTAGSNALEVVVRQRQQTGGRRKRAEADIAGPSRVGVVPPSKPAGKSGSISSGDPIYEFYTKASRDSDLRRTMFTFMPADDAAWSYTACRQEQHTFPVPAEGRTRVHLPDEGFAEFKNLPIGPIPFFGSLYTALYLDSNGYVTFGVPQAFDPVGLDGFFAVPKVAAAATDLDPSVGDGKVFYNQNVEEGYMVRRIPRSPRKGGNT